MKKNSNLVEAHKVERAVNIIMLIFGACAVVIFGLGLTYPEFAKEAVILEMFLVILIAILAQTVILVKLLEKLM